MKTLFELVSYAFPVLNPLMLRLTLVIVLRIYDTFDNNLEMKNNFYQMFEEEFLRAIINISHLDIFSTLLCFEIFH